MAEYSSSGVRLQVLIVRDELDHTVPDLRADVISGSRDELQDGIDIPLVLLVSLFNQQS
jgi:hypothetical protein